MKNEILEEVSMNERTAKQNFSSMGMNLFLFLVIVSILQVICLGVVGVIYGGSDYPKWVFWVANFVPMYCIGLPILYLLMKKVPREDLTESRSFSVGTWIKFLTISFFVMVVGNLIGQLVGLLFSALGINTAAGIEALLNQSTGIGSIVLALIAPIVEELIFRKWLIDRMHVYGGKVAVVTSALMFGLFHGNFSQFFYAFFLGLVWGYVYYKTGKVIYSMLMHMTVNFCGGVIAPMFLTGLDLTDPMSMITSPKFIGLLIYEVIVIVVAIVGFVFFLVGRKEMSYSEERLELPAEERVKTPWGNPGMILYLVGCLALFVISLFSGAAA